MDYDLDTLTALLLDPCLTTDEAEREAAATSRRVRVVGSANRSCPVATAEPCGYAPLLTADGRRRGGEEIGDMAPAVLPPR
jgi:hypothetical protein